MSNIIHIAVILSITCLSLGLIVNNFKMEKSKILFDITIPFIIIFFGFLCIFSNESRVKTVPTTETVYVLVDENGKVLEKISKDIIIEEPYEVIMIPEKEYKKIIKRRRRRHRIIWWR